MSLEDSQGWSVEVWFELTARRLRMTDPDPPGIEVVRPVLQKYFDLRTERALRHMNDPNDALRLTDLVLKIDTMLCLEDQHGKLLRIGVDPTANLAEVPSKIEQIASQRYRAARRELEIDRHWVLAVNPKALPSDERMIDSLYEATDQPQELRLLNLSGRKIHLQDHHLRLLQGHQKQSNNQRQNHRQGPIL